MTSAKVHRNIYGKDKTIMHAAKEAKNWDMEVWSDMLYAQFSSNPMDQVTPTTHHLRELRFHFIIKGLLCEESVLACMVGYVSHLFMHTRELNGWQCFPQ